MPVSYTQLAGDVRFGNFGEHGHRHEPENYRITPEDRLGVGGAKTKYADNVAAIRLLKQLQANGAALATPEEQKILVRYVGWGGLPQVFDAQNEQWAAEYREMQGLLSPEDYAAARRSTQDAHYTSETVIRGIYQGLSKIGLGSGELPVSYTHLWAFRLTPYSVMAASMRMPPPGCCGRNISARAVSGRPSARITPGRRIAGMPISGEYKPIWNCLLYTSRCV